MTTAAVIDVGSNSIKLLVANEKAVLKQTLIFCRLSTGIGKSKKPQLSYEAMKAGTHAIQKLIATAKTFSPTKILIAATSAVRESSNKHIFQEQVLAATDIPLTILSGDEEANFVAKSAVTDKNLKSLKNFLLFDLGGGSLELILFKDNSPIKLQSFKLGNVRLMEHFVKDPKGPISKKELQDIRNEVITTIDESAFPLPAGTALVGIGGVVGTSKKLLNIKGYKIKTEHLKTLQERLMKLTLEERFQIPDLPHGRADILPIALEVMLTLADKLETKELIHSTCNLRFGLMRELLEG